MPVITIRGHSGSFTSEIARRAADRLGVRVMDRQVLEETAKRLNMPVEEVEELEQVPTTRRERILEALGRHLQNPWALVAGPPGQIGVIGLAAYYDHLPKPTDTHEYVKALEEIVHDLATDASVVFTTKGTQVMLNQHESAFHVFITAPLDVRVKRITARNLMSREEDARAMIARIDGQRKAYLKRYFHVDMEDLRLYDLVLNTAKVSPEVAVDTILALSRGTA
ncbi:MAG: cytidylate kinase-like family protein [Chloroflexi bacterium]|nr:cytidylate kinase-like family protein [Chloroflexota bacterium]MBI4198433.1 cytidylate kinase-like family protein [Chloroflexota bacterium]